MAPPYAFVSLLTSDSYLPGALTVAAALRDVHPSPPTTPEVDFHTVCLVTPESVDVSSIKLLRKAFNVVIGVEIIEENNAPALRLLGRPDLTTVLTKLHAFRLTQYEKIIFLDADVLPTRPLSHLFTLPHEFSAVPDVGWPDIFNSGLLVFTPGLDKFDELMALSKTKGSWDGGDQGLLNEWRGSNWNRLSFTYNTTPTAIYTYAPAYERFGSQISAVHFIGPNKPWSSIPWRAPGSSTAQQAASEPLQVYDYSTLVDRWYAVYDKHYRSIPIASHPEYASRRYEAAWDQGSSVGAEAVAPPLVQQSTSVFGLEELRRIAIDGFSGVAGTSMAESGEAEYIRLPLEGRFDLMRPQPIPAPEPGPDSEPSDVPIFGGGGTGARGQGGSGQGGEQEQHGYFSHVGPDPSTPKATARSFYGGSGSPPRMGTLPTPGPDELPPTPHLGNRSLPPTPTPSRSYHQGGGGSGSPTQIRQNGGDTGSSAQVWRGQAQSHASSGEVSGSSIQGQVQVPVRAYSSQTGAPGPGTEGHSQPSGKGHAQEMQEGWSGHLGSQDATPVQEHPYRQDSHGQHSPEQPHRHRQESRANPPRPVSPPMMTWNPAIEPPPNTAPVSNFPSETYYPNVWDQSGDHTTGSEHSPVRESGGLFHVPPQGRIPERLLQERHYANVIGDKQQDVDPSPDRSKVKPVFPWEDTPRHIPGRVFPMDDSPPPGLFLEPVIEEPRSPSPPQHITSPRIYSPSSPAGFPSTFAYTNAWDTVPSIQKYASRLVRSPQSAQPLAPAFDLAESRRRESKLFKSWQHESGESSMDGDDEDTEPEEEEPTKRRSRSGSSASQPFQSGKGKYKKEYRSQGVQTIPKDVRHQSVQVALIVAPSDKDQDGQAPSLRSRQSSYSGKRDSAAGSPVSAPGESFMNAAARLSPLGSPTGLRSPRIFASPKNSSTNLAAAVPSLSKPVPPKQQQQSTPLRTVTQRPSPILRTISSDTTSSPSSAGPPVSPGDLQLQTPPPRKVAGRVWDPARGVDIFKKGSEEVLARFLRMGSWEEEAASARQSQRQSPT
ncbi:hypothetical protein BV25DRAFT_1911162 [Artomyces pyxidatus]|uniref:Uncharacterized protein n=1 Tax=Artomyces pyxidatus TaxID=48021 RepID=A0ACB8TIC9_9AGAM|nr:hypothetical protein BV25DRAFT_1911162 [Artomyces pyxidatus]